MCALRVAEVVGVAHTWDRCATSASDGELVVHDRCTSIAALAAVEERQAGIIMAVWGITAGEDRQQWDFTPLVAVGPLRFGMGHY